MRKTAYMTLNNVRTKFAAKAAQSGATQTVSAAKTQVSTNAEGSKGTVGVVFRYAEGITGAPHATCNAVAAQACAAEQAPAKVTFADAFLGKAPVPKAGSAGKFVFTFLMVLCMVSVMVTINGFQHSGLAFLSNAHWMYPTVFCVAFLIRTFFGDPISGRIIGKFVIPHTKPGLGRTALITLANVVVMASIMSVIVTMLLGGLSVETLLAGVKSIPLTMCIAFCVNMFVVGPAVKMFYNNVVVRIGGFNIMTKFRQWAMPFAAFFGIS
jgi:hypothetical protein